jgi:predicted RNase H-like nuclease
VRGRPGVQVIEAHPEVSFAEMVGVPIVASKKDPAGQQARLTALHGVGIAAPTNPVRGAALDDLLDACAVAWTAARYANGEAISLPDPAERFSDGLDAAIWV